jgi:hypothetical protein
MFIFALEEFEFSDENRVAIILLLQYLWKYHD